MILPIIPSKVMEVEKDVTEGGTIREVTERLNERRILN